MEATHRAIAVAYASGPFSRRSLRHAYAVLMAVLELARLERLPATWSTRRRRLMRGGGRRGGVVMIHSRERSR